MPRMELVLCMPSLLETAVSILSVWYWKIIENPDKMIWFSAKKVLLSPGILLLYKACVRKLVGTSLEAKCRRAVYVQTRRCMYMQSKCKLCKRCNTSTNNASKVRQKQHKNVNFIWHLPKITKHQQIQFWTFKYHIPKSAPTFSAKSRLREMSGNAGNVGKCREMSGKCREMSGNVGAASGGGSILAGAKAAWWKGDMVWWVPRLQ